MKKGTGSLQDSFLFISERNFTQYNGHYFPKILNLKKFTLRGGAQGRMAKVVTWLSVRNGLQ